MKSEEERNVIQKQYTRAKWKETKSETHGRGTQEAIKY